MKKTMSKDGVPRVTVVIKYRLSDEDRQRIAFVNDCVEAPYGTVPSTLRLATYKEMVYALRDGYASEMEWQSEYTEMYENAKAKKVEEV
jgi:hypothetical protein